LSALYSQVRGSDPQVTQASLEDSWKRRDEESRRARARTRILGQVRAEATAPDLTFKDLLTPMRRSRAESEEWCCVCELCKLNPGRYCNVNWPRKVNWRWSEKKGSSKTGSKDGEIEEPDKRRIRLALTWTLPRKRSASPRG
jgi:hypothetical protein